MALSDALGRRLPLFNHSLDWLVVADIDNEDLSGSCGQPGAIHPCKCAVGRQYLREPELLAELQTQLIALSIPVTTMQPGQSLDLGSGASLRVLSIDPKGADLLLEWENFRMLLPMGMDFDCPGYGSCTIWLCAMSSAVLLPESGYAPLNPPELIDFLRPQLAVLSVAPGDKTGLPSPETLDALDGYNLLRTDQNGWIEIITDGKQMWVEVERK